MEKSEIKNFKNISTKINKNGIKISKKVNLIPISKSNIIMEIIGIKKIVQ